VIVSKGSTMNLFWHRRGIWGDTERHHALDCVVDAMDLDVPRRESIFRVYDAKVHESSEAATVMTNYLSEDIRSDVLEAFRVLDDIQKYYCHVMHPRSPIVEGAMTLVSSWYFDAEDDLSLRLAPFLDMDDGRSLRKDWEKVGYELGQAIKRYAPKGESNVPDTSR